MTAKIDEAVQLRKNNNPEKALALLLALYKTAPDDAEINYQIAWTHDCMGQERQAATFYEEALASGLKGDSRRGAFLGLGSTYRCLGVYEKSKDVFDRAVQEFPDDRVFKTFRALTLYNLGQKDKCVEDLLIQLLDTTTDAGIKAYDGALRFYADKLDQTWQ